MDNDQFNAKLFRWDGAAAGIGLVPFLRYPQPIRNANPRLAPHRSRTPSNSNVSTSVNAPNSAVAIRTATGTSGAAHRPQNSPTGARGFFRGSRGQSPPPAPLYPQGVGWLKHLTVVHASPADTRQPLPARRPRRRWPDRLGASSSALFGRQPHGRRWRTADPSLLGGRPRSPARPGFHPARTPLHPAIVALSGAPVARTLPEMPPECPDTASWPGRGIKSGSPSQLSGP